jgi:RimJ/RimL family protein N-acetyltransferase
LFHGTDYSGTIIWNQGITPETLQAFIQFFITQKETKRIESTTRPCNEVARRVFEKNGFVVEGIMQECEHFKDESFDLLV